MRKHFTPPLPAPAPSRAAVDAVAHALKLSAARMRQGSGAPSFCWHCNAQLQRAPGKGLGLFFFNLVRDRAGVEHRVHGEPCTRDAVEDGNVLVDQ